MYQIEVILPIATANAFSYQYNHSIAIGCRVRVPFANKIRIGVVIECAEKNDIDSNIKFVETVLDKKPLLSPLLQKLIEWMYGYYHHWYGIIWQIATPTHFWKISIKDNFALNKMPENPCLKPNIILNKQQKQVIKEINQKNQQFNTFLIYGVTGSGKTEIYLNIAEKIIAQGKQVLVLVPEISLTQQNINRFSNRFKSVGVYHSNQTPKVRQENWNSALHNQCQIMIGTRSAIFSPLKNLGMIIIDEEHDDSYRQFDSVQYSARDVAVMRAKLENIPIILASATPSLESLYNSQKNNYHFLQLSQRTGEAKMPKIRFIDMRKRNASLSDKLIEAIKQRIEKGEQTILFLNRRGYSPVRLCQSCGWVPECIYCQRTPTYHKHKELLHCHICDWRKIAPVLCPSCQSNAFVTIGEGTEQIENLLEKNFPQARIIRLDRDSTRKKGSLQEKLQIAHQRQADIILGTQMISKGHDLPFVTLVGVINTDQGLLSTHYRSEEKLIQLLTQVSGRAGRGELSGEVIIQTYHPNHTLLQNLFTKDYLYCANKILIERKQSKLPPYHHQALFRVEAIDASKGRNFIEQIYEIFKQNNQTSSLYPIAPSSLEKIGQYTRWQFLVQDKNRQTLQKLLTLSLQTVRKKQRPHALRWSLQLNPIDW